MVNRTSSPSAVLPVRVGPRARAVDRVAVHPQPPADGEQPPRLHERDGAVAGRADVEQQVAAVRHDLDEHPYEVVGGEVVVVAFLAVEPERRADAAGRLPLPPGRALASSTRA